VSAITVLVFFFSAWDERRLWDALICVAAFVFTVMTQSKSSLLLLPIALAAGAIYRLAWRTALDRLIATVVLGLMVVSVASFVLVDQGAVARIFSDPEGFTGRSEIWQAELSFIRDHPYLGAGFGSFADTGALSPLRNYMSSNWVGTVAHGHNAYLQLYVTIGGIGLALAVVALIVLPLVAFWRGTATQVTQLSMLFAIFVFMALHNFLESDFLEGDGPAWVAFLLMLAALRLTRGAKAIAP
jgi:O-antigen ligase